VVIDIGFRATLGLVATAPVPAHLARNVAQSRQRTKNLRLCTISQTSSKTLSLVYQIPPLAISGVPVNHSFDIGLMFSLGIFMAAQLFAIVEKNCRRRRLWLEILT
jgi:hypothetical protein